MIAQKSRSTTPMSCALRPRRLTWRGERPARGGLEDGVSNDPIEERLREVIIGEIEPQKVVVADYDPTWPERFLREEAKIRAALGEAALSVEHVSSTSVPGLAAKPIVDVLLVVENSGEEATYLPAMEEAGYVLRVREPDFDEHRMFRTPAKD